MLPIRNEPNPSNFAPPFLLQRFKQNTSLEHLKTVFHGWQQDVGFGVRLPPGNARVFGLLPLATGPAFLSTSFPLPAKPNLDSIQKLGQAGELAGFTHLLEGFMTDLIEGFGVGPCEACGNAKDTTVRITVQCYQESDANCFMLSPVVPTCPSQECSVHLAAALKKSLASNATPLMANHRFLNSCRNCKSLQTEGAKLLCCSRCRAVRYCDEKCQLEDWPTHKRECKSLKIARETGKQGL